MKLPAPPRGYDASYFRQLNHRLQQADDKAVKNEGGQINLDGDIHADGDATFDVGSGTFTVENDGTSVLEVDGASSEVTAAGTVQGTTGNGHLDLAGDSGATVTARLTDAGLFALGDTANTGMTVGLTLNQGAADDEIAAFKSSDVSHGITNLAEADTYGTVRKTRAADGGMDLRGFGTAASGSIAVRAFGSGQDTRKTTAALGGIILDARKDDGASGSTALGTDGNIATIETNGTTRFIFDAEGSGHADVEWTTYDRHDDLQVIEDMEALLAPGAVQRRFGEVVTHDRAFFEREGLFHDIRETGEGRMRGMMNWTRMLMLHSGAIRQVGGRMMDVEARVEELESENERLRGQVRALRGLAE